MAANSVTWTREHTLSAFHLYTLLPFGKLSQRTPEIQQLASWQGRTPGSLAMKLVNFASLDPQITSTGRVGLTGASAQDKELWSEFQLNWDESAQEAANAYELLATTHGVAGDSPLIEEDEALTEEEGQTRGALVQVRVNQARFRRAVLASYGSTCCISGLKHPRLLVASHIMPWSRDTKNRLNPKNGLCLSALHDRAYDQGLITVLPDYTVRLCDSLRSTQSSSALWLMLASCEGQRIADPQRFSPNPEFLEWHATHFGFL